MIRKLISLPEDLVTLIELTALQEQKPVKRQDHALLNIAKHAVSGLDPHISTQIDTYLYEE